jgi:hypothetical protein
VEIETESRKMNKERKKEVEKESGKGTKKDR